MGQPNPTTATEVAEILSATKESNEVTVTPEGEEPEEETSCSS